MKELKKSLATATTDVRAEDVFEENESKRVLSAAGELVVGIGGLLAVLGKKLCTISTL